MNKKIYLTLYKGNRDGTGFKVQLSRFSDFLTRKLTKGRYSHCELAISTDNSDLFDCYSSSIRDGGVRVKTMRLPENKWDFIELTNISEQQIKYFFNQTKGKKYDWFGAIGVVFKTRQHQHKYFCSEWCAQCLGLPESWRFSPNDLAVIVKGVSNGKNA